MKKAIKHLKEDIKDYKKQRKHLSKEIKEDKTLMKDIKKQALPASMARYKKYSPSQMKEHIGKEMKLLKKKEK